MVDSNAIHGPEDGRSSARKGADFERLVREHFAKNGDEPVVLTREFPVSLGFTEKKDRAFDLGIENPPLIIECKAHSWTRNENVPMGKLQAWNEAMLYFSLAPKRYRKALCVAYSFSEKRGETLAEYYVRTFRHLVPPDVTIIEIDGMTSKRLI